VAAGKYARAGAKLLDILGRDRCAIAGGMAVNAHGFVRATRDVDVMTAMALDEARRKLRERDVAARLVKGDALEGGFDCLKGVIGVGAKAAEAIPFDILPALVPFDPARAIEIVVRGSRLAIVDADTLMRLKLTAGSIKDLYDIAMLANLHPSWAERAIALATEARSDTAQRLADLIRDPRVRAEARDVRRQDADLRAFAKRRRRRQSTPSR
jgi:nucleotidyltransferase AbiEii toxin of type IV toxin-antitoxin system